MPAKVMLVHQTAALNPPEEAHAGSAVSLLRLIFTVLHLLALFLLFLFLYNSVIGRLQREREHTGVSAHTNRWWKAAALSEVPPLSFFFFFLQANAHVRFDPVYSSVRARGVSEGRIGGSAFVILNFSFASHRSAPRLDSGEARGWHGL